MIVSHIIYKHGRARGPLRRNAWRLHNFAFDAQLQLRFRLWLASRSSCIKTQDCLLAARNFHRGLPDQGSSAVPSILSAADIGILFVLGTNRYRRMIYRAAASTLQLPSLPDIVSPGIYYEPPMTLIGDQPRLKVRPWMSKVSSGA